MSYSTELCQVKDKLDKCLVVIRKYDWLLDSHVLDHYTESHWKKLPNSWLEALMIIDLPELAQFMDSITPKVYSRVWPLSLLALRETVAQLSVPRQPFDHHSPSKEWLNICCKTTLTMQEDSAGNKQSELERTTEQNNISTSFSPKANAPFCMKERVQIGKELESSACVCTSSRPFSTSPNIPNPKLAIVFRKHVTPKKRHEIDKIAQIIGESAKQSGCDFVLDVGSGRGHLARMLAYGKGLKVCCLEAQSSLLLEASRFDLELEKMLSKHSQQLDQVEKSCRPVHLNLTLNHLTSQEEIVEGLKMAFGKTADEELKFGIVGLHPCGDLASILIRLFTNCLDARFINIVGCCFMKLTTEVCSPYPGYPMSNFLHTRRNSSELSYIARELACHAVETYCYRLQKRQSSDLKVHCYRAALEEIIAKNWPSLKHSPIKSVKYRKDMTFSEYCFAALSKLSVEIPVIDLTSEKTLQNLLEWKQVVTFFTLRLLLAPLVETVILLDRLLFIRELGIDGILTPVFDPKLSPRNHILIAHKRKET